MTNFKKYGIWEKGYVPEDELRTRLLVSMSRSGIDIHMNNSWQFTYTHKPEFSPDGERLGDEFSAISVRYPEEVDEGNA